jgi:hypothetical protein
MRKRGRRLALLGLVALLVTGCASGPHTTTQRSPVTGVVPLGVQREIARRFPLLAFIPRKLPAGFRYAKYFSTPPDGLVIQFNRIGEPAWGPGAIHFQVTGPYHGQGQCRFTGTKLRVNGVAVYWSGTNAVEEAVRCITTGKTVLLVNASRSEPIRRADALELARLVVEIKHIR